MKSGLFFSVSFLYLITSCADGKTTKSKQGNLKIESNSDYQIYIDRFVEEGAKRGVEVDMNGFNLIISDTLNFYCGYGTRSTKTVEISNRLECWAQRSELDKEILMFPRTRYFRPSAQY